MAEAFFDDADAQTFHAALKSLDVTTGGDAALARVDAVRPGDDFQQQGVVADGLGHGAASIDGHLQRRDARVGDEAEGRLQPDDAAKTRRDADRAGLIAADRHVDLAGGNKRAAA